MSSFRASRCFPTLQNSVLVGIFLPFLTANQLECKLTTLTFVMIIDQQKKLQLVTLKLRNPYVSHSLKIATVDIWIRYIEVYSYTHTLHSLLSRAKISVLSPWMTDNKIKRDWLIKRSQLQFYIQLVYKPQFENMNFYVCAVWAAKVARAARAVDCTGSSTVN